MPQQMQQPPRTPGPSDTRVLPVAGWRAGAVASGTHRDDLGAVGDRGTERAPLDGGMGGVPSEQLWRDAIQATRAAAAAAAELRLAFERPAREG